MHIIEIRRRNVALAQYPVQDGEIIISRAQRRERMHHVSERLPLRTHLIAIGLAIALTTLRLLVSPGA